MKKHEETMYPGQALGDMHYGIQGLEFEIDGFVLKSHSTISTSQGSFIINTLLKELDVSSPSVHNKILYLLGEDSSGFYKAVYTYDGHTFGIVVFSINN